MPIRVKHYQRRQHRQRVEREPQQRQRQQRQQDEQQLRLARARWRMVIPSSLFSLENLYRAYCQCRRRKRSTHNALAFETDLEGNLLQLRKELLDGSYQPGSTTRLSGAILGEVKFMLWESGVPVAWIRETGVSITTVRERVVVERWEGVHHRSLVELSG